MFDFGYPGEHLGPRFFGHAVILIAFFSALLSGLGYFLGTFYREERLRGSRWGRLGQLSFLVHGLALFAVIGTIFYVMLNEYYEFNYVSAHVSGDLQKRYIFSAFWEGQEGSFLLWSFWHVILGYVIMLTAGKWERPVMTVICSAQFIITSMLLGVHFGVGDFALKFGSNPMLLLREVVNAPIFQQADYVELLKGSGLNPSLQNYWMTIHPPTLFLGFASVIVPFAFAVAGLWLNDHKGWLRPALRWALFSGGILGIGILMGAAWAYEALNFGGYWAWDPVENTSLVPWLLVVAGIHTTLIARATGQGIRASYIFFLLSFVLIIYSTFLTRSGILGDTSVHAFTEMGLETQLLIFLGFYGLLSIGLMVWRWKKVPVPAQEESIASREFWMFIGSLILVISAVLIIGATSLPVYNSIAEAFNPIHEGLSLADPEDHHNRYQIWIAIFIGLATGLAHFLRWRENEFRTYAGKFALRLGGAVAGAAVMTLLTLWWIEAPTPSYKLMIFSGWVAVTSNLDYLLRFARSDTKVFGSSLSHIGFGIMLIGIMASGANKRVISQNTFLMEGLSENEELERTTIILIEDEPLVMENYELQLTGDTIVGYNRTYFVDYLQRNPSSGEVIERFQLEPNLIYDKSFEKIAITNPSTKRYWDKDIFTVIMSMPEEEQSIKAKEAKEDSLKYRTYPLLVGEQLAFNDTLTIREPDTFLIRDFRISLNNFARVPRHPDYKPQPGDIGVSAGVTVERMREDYDPATVQVALVLREGLLYHYPAQINPLGTRVKIDERVFEELLVPEQDLDYQEFVVSPGESFTMGDQIITVDSLTPQPQLDHYQATPGDIAVAARLSAVGPDGRRATLDPVFIIRDRTPSRVRDEDRSSGLFANLININPSNGQLTLMVAQGEPREELRVPIAVATNSARSDWVALQAIEFPGINLFWFGSISMLLGLLINMGVRLLSRRRV